MEVCCRTVLMEACVVIEACVAELLMLQSGFVNGEVCWMEMTRARAEVTWASDTYCRPISSREAASDPCPGLLENRTS